MLDDEIQMHADQACQRGRQHPDVSGEESLQCERAQVRTAAQGFEDEVADKRHASCNLRADGGRPIRLLIPWQKITSKSHAEREDEQSDADQPCQFTRIFEGSGYEHSQHMDEDHDDHQGRAPMMDAADQPAKRDAVHDVIDAVVSVIGRRRVIDRQENPRHALQDK